MGKLAICALAVVSCLPVSRERPFTRIVEPAKSEFTLYWTACPAVEAVAVRSPSRLPSISNPRMPALAFSAVSCTSAGNLAGDIRIEREGAAQAGTGLHQTLELRQLHLVAGDVYPEAAVLQIVGCVAIAGTGIDA